SPSPTSAAVVAQPPAAPARRPDERAVNGRTIGTYELGELLGEGGIGQVYAAQDRVLGRPVAIKMLRPELSRDRSLVERFYIEAKSLGNLNHTNITTLYALHAEGEDAFMVMELVHGVTLEALLRRAQRLGLRDSLASSRRRCDEIPRRWLANH
ncbi:MAG TPA: protein kinase, partial [Stellaceae bacterium]|nr:protein kinase [Stellaceae bacterium]